MFILPSPMGLPRNTRFTKEPVLCRSNNARKTSISTPSRPSVCDKDQIHHAADGHQHIPLEFQQTNLVRHYNHDLSGRALIWTIAKHSYVWDDSPNGTCFTERQIPGPQWWAIASRHNGCSAGWWHISVFSLSPTHLQKMGRKPLRFLSDRFCRVIQTMKQWMSIMMSVSNWWVTYHVSILSWPGGDNLRCLHIIHTVLVFQ